MKKNKYKGIKIAGHKVQVHRFVMEQYLRRKLNRYEVVHHKDGDKTNNSIDNLEVMSLSEHSKQHRTGTKMPKSAIEKLRVNSRKHRTAAKLTPKNVKCIRKLLKTNMMQKDIAKLYDVDIATINKIRFNITWGWVE
jgi:hypothetical protein